MPNPSAQAAAQADGARPSGASGLVRSGAFLSVLGASAFAFAFPLLASGAGWSFGDLGAAFTIYYLIRMLFSPLAGTLSDRFGPRATLVPAALVGAVVPLYCLADPTPLALAAVQCLLGLCGAAIRPASAAAVAEAGGPGALGRRFGSYNAMISLAFFLGPLAGGALFFTRDPAPVAIFLSASMALAAAAFALSPSTGPKQNQARRLRENASARPYFTDAPLYLSALCAIAGRTIQAAALVSFYPLILSHKTGGGALETSLLYAAPPLAAFLILPFAGRLSDGRDKTLFALCGMLAGSLALGFAGAAGDPFWLFAAGLAMGGGAALSLPASMSLAASCGTATGKLMGAAHSAAGAGFLIGPMLCALAASRAGRLEAALPAAACAGIVLCLPLCALAIERRLHYARPASFALAALLLAPALLFWPASGRTIPAAGGQENLYEQTRAAMGTLVTLTMEAPDERTAERAADAAFERIAVLRADFDHRNPYGSVGRINLAAGKSPAAVSPEAFALIEKALFFARMTDGVFDPAIGAVTATPFYFLSPDEALRAKKDLADYRLVVLDPTARTVYLPRPGMALDLGGLAKGAIVDAAVGVLIREGVRAGIVEAGGDAFFFGARTWTAGLKNPRGEGTIGTVPIENMALCGSGDYERYVDVGTDAAGGATKRRHHILDPRAMAPAGISAGAYVLAPDAVTADALATALFALGPEEGALVLSRAFPRASALWVSPRFAVEASPGFPPVAR